MGLVISGFGLNFHHLEIPATLYFIKEYVRNKKAPLLGGFTGTFFTVVEKSERKSNR